MRNNLLSKAHNNRMPLPRLLKRKRPPLPLILVRKKTS